jgi:hypothetical protein
MALGHVVMAGAGAEKRGSGGVLVRGGDVEFGGAEGASVTLLARRARG